MTEKDRKHTLKAFNQFYEAWQDSQYLEYCIYVIEDLLYKTKNEKWTVADVIDECKYPCFPGFEDLDQKTPLTKLKVEYTLPYINYGHLDHIPDFFDHLDLTDNIINEVKTYPDDFFFDGSELDIKQDKGDPYLFHVNFNNITWSLRLSVKYKRNEYQVIGLRTYPNRPIENRYETYVKEMRDHFKTVEHKLEIEKITYSYPPDYSYHMIHMDLTNNKKAIEMYENSSLLEDWAHRCISDQHKIWYTRKNINQLGYKNPTDREITEH